MSRVTAVETVFQPHNEPYLGRYSVLKLDELIVMALEKNARVVPITSSRSLSRVQEAALIIVPQGLSLALSIRELVRQAYLFGGCVLLRPLAERATTIHYLMRYPDELDKWERGWKHSERPSLNRMARTIAADSGDAEMANELSFYDYNSVTHGDPGSGWANRLFVGQGGFVQAASKMLGCADLCDKICTEATAWLLMLGAALGAIFPRDGSRPC